MKSNMKKCLQLVFGSEGGFVNAKTDRGGPTKYGVTAQTLGNWRKLGRPATVAEVKALTITESAQIMEEQYAAPIRFDDLPSGLDYCAFDFAINSGPAQAVKTLQKTLGVAQDGFLGVNTLSAIKDRPVHDLIDDYCDERMNFLRKLGGSQGFRANGRGWTIRVTGVDPKGEWKTQPGVVGNAHSMAGGTTTSPASLPEGADQPASPTQQKITSTTQGKGAVATLVGVVASQADDARTTIEPLVGNSQMLHDILVGVTFLGIGCSVIGAIAVGWGIYKRIASGAPS